jgi:hypothetical protein
MLITYFPSAHMRIIRTLFYSLSVLALSISTAIYQKPKLVVVVSYNQLRYDRLACFIKTQLSKVLSAFLMAVFATEWLFVWCITSTIDQKPGHAVLLTGCNPHRTGVAQNGYDRKQEQAVVRYRGSGWLLSPRNLRVSTLGDILKQYITFIQSHWYSWRGESRQFSWWFIRCQLRFMVRRS